MQYDVAIIGAGVVGSMIARALSQYELNTVVLERHAEPAEETSAIPRTLLRNRHLTK